MMEAGLLPDRCRDDPMALRRWLHLHIESVNRSGREVKLAWLRMRVHEAEQEITMVGTPLNLPSLAHAGSEERLRPHYIHFSRRYISSCRALILQVLCAGPAPPHSRNISLFPSSLCRVEHIPNIVWNSSLGKSQDGMPTTTDKPVICTRLITDLCADLGHQPATKGWQGGRQCAIWQSRKGFRQ